MSDPPDPPDLQVCRIQEHNYEEQRKALLHPLTIRSLAVGSEVLDIRLQHHHQTTKSLSQLTPDDARQFAHKSTAIYAPSSSLNISSGFALFLQIYDIWFPCRPREIQPNSLWYGDFFANVAKLDLEDNPNPEKSTFPLRELCAFHSRLATRLSELLPQTLTPELSALNRRWGDERVGGKYQLRECWGKVFVWMDSGDWKGEGVKVIARDGPVAERLGLGNEQQEGVGEKESLEGWPDAKVYRMDLERAIRAILALDGGEGVNGRMEWNYITQRWYGGCLEE